MAVKIQISGQDKVVADVIATGLITLISDITKIYTGADWLTCDGSAVSRTTYADLFAVIGTTYGPGDGTTTFNLPNANSLLNLKKSIGGNTTFGAFTVETIITCTNSSNISIDISAGATAAGIRLTIIKQNNYAVTINTGINMSCELPKGMIVLEWDGTQWCLIGETVRTLVTKTSGGTWITPFGAVYKLTPVGGGGGGGGANPGSYDAFGGGGAGGTSQQLAKYEPAGTSLTVAIGSGGAGGASGANGANGNNTTINDLVITLTGMGGGGGGGASGGSSTGYGWGGAHRYCTAVTAMSVEIGLTGRGAGGSYSGAGSNGACGAGLGGAAVTAGNNGNNGGNYGGGGSGGAAAGGSGTSRTGGNGAAGVAYIEY